MTVESLIPRERPDTAQGLVIFHTRHKLLLMAHAPSAVSQLGRLVARAGSDDLDALWQEYTAGFRATLSTPASRGGHVNALQHAVGYFRGILEDAARLEIARAIEQYVAGVRPLEAPIALIRAHAEQHGLAYLTSQVYLQSPAWSDVKRLPPGMGPREDDC